MNRMPNDLLPDLRLPFGILVAIVLGAASAVAGYLLNVDLRYITQIGIGALIAVDLHRRPLTPYDTIFAIVALGLQTVGLCLPRVSGTYGDLSTLSTEATAGADDPVATTWSPSGELSLTIQNPHDTTASVLTPMLRRLARIGARAIVNGVAPVSVTAVTSMTRVRGGVTMTMPLPRHTWIARELTNDSLAAERS